MTTLRVLLLSVPLASSSFAASYVETFFHTSTSDVGHNHSEIGWRAYGAANAVDVSSNSSGTGFLVSQAGGVSGGGRGYGAKANASAFGIAFTEEVASLNISTVDLTSISFASRNQATSDLFRIVVAVNVGGDNVQWYATSTTYAATTAAGTWKQDNVFDFVTTGSAWQALTFTPGSQLSLSNTTLDSPLPEGTLAAAGLFLSGSTGATNISATMRYDNFAVNYVPEPSTALLGALALGIGACRRSRKI